MIIPLPSQEYLAACFSYDPLSGELRWKVRPRDHFKTDVGWLISNKRFAGTLIRRSHSLGYGRVSLQGRGFFAHRVIWKLVTGDDVAEVDHLDVNPRNDAWDNLRVAEHFQNLGNQKISVRNKVGLKGVQQRGSRFRAFIRAGGKTVALGSYATKEAAHAAYCEAARNAFGAFWNAG